MVRPLFRVHHADAREPFEDVALARGCGLPQERWWCAALEGFVLHALAKHEETERAFSVALFEMDVERAWRWRVPVRSVDSDARRVLEALRTAPVDSVQRVLGRLWALADPLYLGDGSTVRNAHSWNRIDQLQALFLELAEGLYRVRVVIIGRRPTASESFILNPDTHIWIDGELPWSTIVLDGTEGTSGTNRFDTYRYAAETCERDTH